MFSFDPNLYVMGYDASSSQTLSIPILLPVSACCCDTSALHLKFILTVYCAHTRLQGPKQVVETQIECIDPQGRAGQVLVLLYNLAASAANRCAYSTVYSTALHCIATLHCIAAAALY